MDFRKKYIKRVVYVALLVTATIGTLWFTRPSIQTYIPKAELEDYAFVLDGRGLVLDWKESWEFLKIGDSTVNPYEPVSVGQRYVVREEISLNYMLYDDYTSSARNTYERGEYFNLVIYDMEKDMAKRTLDVFDVVREYDENLVPSSEYTLYLSEDTEYVEILTWDKTKLNELYHVTLYIDLADLSVKNVIKYSYPENQITGTLEEITEAEQFQETIWYQRGRDFLDFRSGVVYDSISSKYISLWSYFLKIYDVDKSKLDAESWSFRRIYPDAYKMFIEENKYLDYSIIYLLPGYNSMEQQADALALFYPEGTNIFEGITIDAKYSVDGQAHEVNSREEFFRYYKQTEEVSE
ncbi:TPA: hypothetical protein TXL57_000360 [Streptococcus suis]|nr:hypothetical protein [Streptococcus suis]